MMATAIALYLVMIGMQEESNLMEGFIMEREEIIMEECLALEHSLEETVGFQVLERGIIRVQAAGLQEVKFNLCLPLAQAIHILPDHFQVAHLAEADLQAITLMQVSAPMALSIKSESLYKCVPEDANNCRQRTKCSKSRSTEDDPSSNHFDASLGSDGSITISLPGAEGVSAGDPSSAISLIPP